MSAPLAGVGVSGHPVSKPAWLTGPSEAGLDVASLATAEGNRWSRKGEATVYLAGDPGVALAELARHWEEQNGDVAVWSSHLSLRAAVDLRDSHLRERLGLLRDPTWILDAEMCRTVASRFRSDGEHDGLIVPSVAFLDDPSRWNAVVFVERQSRQLAEVIILGAREILVASGRAWIGGD